MFSMFIGCSSLTSLNILSFDTSSIGSTFFMFGEYKFLTSLDLSHFDTYPYLLNQDAQGGYKLELKCIKQKKRWQLMKKY